MRWHLECADLSALFHFAALQSGDKSPHSKIFAG
jgi:hypothetical protein